MSSLFHRLRKETQWLLAGEGARVGDAQSDFSAARVLAWLTLLIAGTACYGAAIGIGRAPQQAVFVAIKMPVLILLTLFLNGLLNGMLAAILGAGLSFRDTLFAIGRSFAVFALIVGGIGLPAASFTLTLPEWNDPGGRQWYRTLLLIHTGVIAGGGVLANMRLFGTLAAACGRAVARRVLVAWLAGNLFVGAQLSYTLRPFFGNPDLPVQFLRPNPFQGNFYEAVWRLSRGWLNEL